MPPELQTEIEDTRSQPRPTGCPVGSGLEAHLHKAVPVLDHGFVKVVDYMGDDASIVQAARVSYGEGTKKTRDDEGLIRYLMRHAHTTPFEMCDIRFHVKAPIFVARQWMRHRTASVNEVSGRYSVLKTDCYIPDPEHLGTQSKTNKQGRGDDILNEEDADRVITRIKDAGRNCDETYGQMLHPDVDLSRELARIVLPLNTYTEWYWKIDLHNLFHFLQLRLDEHAQYEIRVYAEAIALVIKGWVPLAWKAFEDYRLNAVSLSAQGVDCVRRMLRGEQVTHATSGMSAREWRAFEEAFGR
ncbi:MAG: FAD-dependent thymidylate synthase [Rhodobacteraceae bacterium]|nr:FAD-dependent thymidylate synthase [Paracoccaceae bacterium]